MKRKLLAAFTLLSLAASLSPVSAADGDASALECVDIFDGGTPQTKPWTGPATGLTFEVQFEAATCADATYTQFVQLDKEGLHGDVAGHGDNDGVNDGIVQVTANGNGTDTLIFEIPIPDNDGTICTWTVASGTMKADANSNGNTVDDQHKKNDGNNKDGRKHDWTTVTDRAPDTHPDCLPLYTVPPPPGTGAGGQRYN